MNVRPPKDEDLKVNDPEDVARIMQKVLLRQNKIRRQQEYFWVVGLNTAKDIVFIELAALGGLNKVHVKPADLFRVAVQKVADSVIFVHNHPSGKTEPSQSDIHTIRKLRNAGQTLEIDVVDAIIITEEDFTSFFDKL
ncbi:MAG: hypothetical protein Roseis2KO_02550 [Roseivirga sp.]